ncbi:MAG TPA: hypothetical protein VJJ98_09955 [Sedimentisphaerales bacterium]|nr:hypothetical protein [Sedimentisphaerales bacterium]
MHNLTVKDADEQPFIAAISKKPIGSSESVYEKPFCRGMGIPARGPWGLPMRRRAILALQLVSFL